MGYCQGAVGSGPVAETVPIYQTRDNSDNNVVSLTNLVLLSSPVGRSVGCCSSMNRWGRERPLQVAATSSSGAKDEECCYR